MNSQTVQTLNQYGGSFIKFPDGTKDFRSTNYVIGFVSMWQSIENINELVADIDKCINGQYNLIEDPILFIHTFMTEITPEGFKFYDRNEDGTKITGFDIFPLEDIKILLLAWKDFLMND